MEPQVLCVFGPVALLGNIAGQSGLIPLDNSNERNSRLARLDRHEDSLMAILAAEMTDPGSTGTGLDLDSITDQLAEVRRLIEGTHE